MDREEHRPGKQIQFCDPRQVTSPWVSPPTCDLECGCAGGCDNDLVGTGWQFWRANHVPSNTRWLGPHKAERRLACPSVALGLYIRTQQS